MTKNEYEDIVAAYLRDSAHYRSMAEFHREEVRKAEWRQEEADKSMARVRRPDAPVRSWWRRLLVGGGGEPELAPELAPEVEQWNARIKDEQVVERNKADLSRQERYTEAVRAAVKMSEEKP